MKKVKQVTTEWIKCPLCSGAGLIPACELDDCLNESFYGVRFCTRCKGKGEVPRFIKTEGLNFKVT